MKDRPIPDWQLERLLLGELPAPQATALRERLQTDEEARDRLAALERDSAAFAFTHPAEKGRAEIERRAGVRRRQRARAVLFSAAPLVAAAAALVLVLLPRPDTDQTRLKGLAPRLLVFARAGTEATPLRDGATVHPHDTLQTGYVAAGRRHGALLSIDGRGGVTVHWPEPGQPADLTPPRAGSGQVLLPVAYELDDAPAFERFFLVTSRQPLDLEAVVAAARALAADPARAAHAPLPLGRGLEQVSVLLKKSP